MDGGHVAGRRCPGRAAAPGCPVAGRAARPPDPARRWPRLGATGTSRPPGSRPPAASGRPAVRAAGSAGRGDGARADRGGRRRGATPAGRPPVGRRARPAARSPPAPRATPRPTGASPASMCPPGWSHSPRRLCRCSTTPRSPTTIADAVTCTLSACSSNGRSSRSSSVRNVDDRVALAGVDRSTGGTAARTPKSSATSASSGTAGHRRRCGRRRSGVLGDEVPLLALDGHEDEAAAVGEQLEARRAPGPRPRPTTAPPPATGRPSRRARSARPPGAARPARR